MPGFEAVGQRRVGHRLANFKKTAVYKRGTLLEALEYILYGAAQSALRTTSIIFYIVWELIFDFVVHSALARTVCFRIAFYR